MAVKAEEEEAGVLSMVELLSSPLDQLLVLQPGAGPAGPVPQQSYEGDDVGEFDYLSMYRPPSKSASGLPGQDDLLREEAGGGAGLLCH